MFSLTSLRSIIGICLTGALSLPFASAQDLVHPGKPHTARGVRFVCAAIAPETPTTLKLASKNELVDVSLSIRSPGELMKIPDDGSIILGIPTNDPDRPLQPLATAKLPDSSKSATVLLIPTPKQADGICYRSLIIGDDVVRGGDVYLLSLLDSRCAFRMEGKDLLLSKDKPQIYHPSNLEQPRNIPMSVSVELPNAKGAKEWKLLTASTWRLIKTRVEVCVVYWNASQDRPALKGITLFPEDVQTAR